MCDTLLIEKDKTYVIECDDAPTGELIEHYQQVFNSLGAQCLIMHRARIVKVIQES